MGAPLDHGSEIAPTACLTDIAMTHHPFIHRRELLQIGASSLLGIGLPELFAGQAMSSPGANTPARNRSVILVLLTGGPSQLDTLDMKTEAPAEIRGEFKPIATRIPGIQICEHLPQLAARMHYWALDKRVRRATPCDFGPR